MMPAIKLAAVQIWSIIHDGSHQFDGVLQHLLLPLLLLCPGMGVWMSVSN